MYNPFVLSPLANPPTDGTDHFNYFYGTEISDTFYGLKGTDFMFGGDGSDRIYGASGKDQLTGGTGQDFLYGGNGADLFIYNSAGEAGKGKMADVIGDFKSGDDHLVLNFMAGGTFIADAAFSKSGHAEVRYDQATGTLSGDVNGDGKVDFQITFTNHVDLQAADILF